MPWLEYISSWLVVLLGFSIKTKSVTCGMETGDTGKSVVSFSLSQETWESGELLESKREYEMFRFHQWGRKIGVNYSFLCMLFNSGFQWIEDADVQLQLGGQVMGSTCMRAY